MLKNHDLESKWMTYRMWLIDTYKWFQNESEKYDMLFVETLKNLYGIYINDYADYESDYFLLRNILTGELFITSDLINNSPENILIGCAEFDESTFKPQYHYRFFLPVGNSSGYIKLFHNANITSKITDSSLVDILVKTFFIKEHSIVIRACLMEKYIPISMFDVVGGIKSLKYEDTVLGDFMITEIVFNRLFNLNLSVTPDVEYAFSLDELMDKINDKLTRSNLTNYQREWLEHLKICLTY